MDDYNNLLMVRSPILLQLPAMPCVLMTGSAGSFLLESATSDGACAAGFPLLVRNSPGLPISETPTMTRALQVLCDYWFEHAESRKHRKC